MREITSAGNPSIKLYKKLAEGKKYRRETGLFTLEGVRLIEDALKENAELKSVFITASCMEKYEERGGLPGFRRDTEVFAIPDSLGGKISSTDNAQGIFAVCRMLDNPAISDIIKSAGKYAVLHNIQDPGNMGTIIRAADAFGADAVIAADCCDIYSPKTVRSTMGSLFRIKLLVSGIDEVFAELKAKNVISYAAVVDKNAVPLTECRFEKGAAVFIGNEGNGLPEEISSACDKRLTIPMRGNANSLNAAAAASIILWELTK